VLFTSWILDRWPVLLFDTVALVIAGGLLVGHMVLDLPLRLHWSLLAPLSAACIACLQIATGSTVNPNATMLAAYDWAGFTSLYFLALQFFDRIPSARKYFGPATMIFALYCIFAVTSWFTAHGLIFWRFPNAVNLTQVMGTILNRNHFAAYMELFIPLLFWRFIDSPRRHPEAAVGVGILFAAVVASTSRGGLAVAIFELVAVFLLARYWESRMFSSRRSSSWLLAGAVGSLVLFTAAIGTGPLQDRLFKDRPIEFLTDYEESRWEYAEASMKMVAARPVTGFGLGTWPELYPAYGVYDSPYAYVNHAHNDAVEWLAEGGLIFLIPLGLLVAFREPWAFGPLAVVVHSLVDFPLQKPAIVSAMLLFLAAGIVCGRTASRSPQRATSL
jgi:O-antigen ligase